MKYNSIYDLYWLYKLVHGTSSAYRMFELESMHHALTSANISYPIKVLETHCGEMEYYRLIQHSPIDTVAYVGLDLRHGIPVSEWAGEPQVCGSIQDFAKHQSRQEKPYRFEVACSHFNSISSGDTNTLGALQDYLRALKAVTTQAVYLNVSRAGQSDSLADSIGESESFFVVPYEVYGQHATVTLTHSVSYNRSQLLYEHRYEDVVVMLSGKGKPKTRRITIESPLTFKTWTAEEVAMCAKEVGFSEVLHFFNDANFSGNGFIHEHLQDDDPTTATDLLLIV